MIRSSERRIFMIDFLISIIAQVISGVLLYFIIRLINKDC
uniref:Uncharacterized protein n=1 Tax=Myoviridae sp. ctIty1 TaxID=2827673 RepID=A0A8S5TGI9_9CAUD|nr:MAG TPA: hypothetical protein [Myoviridae sp. ctIty1]